MSAHHADLIARLRAEGRIWREQVGDMPLFDQAADALEAQSAPLLADSREALVKWERYTFGISNGTQAWVEFQGAIGTVTDALLASGVVSLAADRDRAEKEALWDEGYDAASEFMDGPDWAEPPINPYRRAESEGE